MRINAGVEEGTGSFCRPFRMIPQGEAKVSHNSNSNLHNFIWRRAASFSRTGAMAEIIHDHPG